MVESSSRLPFAGALVEVTSKFEQVVKQMREAGRSLLELESARSFGRSRRKALTGLNSLLRRRTHKYKYITIITTYYNM